MTEPLDAYYMKERRRIEERRKLVALPANAKKSNRALAKELGIGEGTIRRDRNWLALPADQRPVPNARVLAKPKIKTKKPYDPSNTKRHRKLMLAAAKQWTAQVGVILADVGSIVGEAGKQLYFNRQLIANLPPPSTSPRYLLAFLRPTRDVSDYMPERLYFLAEWLTRWLAYCLPNDEEEQQVVLSEIVEMTRARFITEMRVKSRVSAKARAATIAAVVARVKTLGISFAPYYSTYW